MVRRYKVIELGSCAFKKTRAHKKIEFLLPIVSREHNEQKIPRQRALLAEDAAGTNLRNTRRALIHDLDDSRS